MDMILEVEHIPLGGETILAGGMAYAPGGKGANQGVSAGRLGGRVRMLGAVGRDDFGRALLQSLGAAGVDTSRVLRDENAPTGMAVIAVDQRGTNSIVVLPGANTGCTVDYLRANDDLFTDCDFILLQMEIPFAAVAYAVRRGRALGKTVVLNPAPAPSAMEDELLACIDYMTPNESELAALTGLPCETVRQAEAAGRVLLDRGIRYLLVTLGAQGALLISADGSRRFGCEAPGPVVDTTGAGDCFNAAFVLGLSEGMPPGDAIRFACTAAAISVTRAGAQNSVPTRAEVDAQAYLS
jgi:ribokinase